MISMIQYSIRNAVGVAVIIVIGYITISFLRGSFVKDKLYGNWESIEIQDEVSFTETICSHNGKTVEYKVRGNRIILYNGEQYKFTLTNQYLVFNGSFYSRR